VDMYFAPKVQNSTPGPLLSKQSAVKTKLLALRYSTELGIAQASMRTAPSKRDSASAPSMLINAVLKIFLSMRSATLSAFV
jgi:hypothetical protein